MILLHVAETRTTKKEDGDIQAMEITFLRAI